MRPRNAILLTVLAASLLGLPSLLLPSTQPAGPAGAAAAETYRLVYASQSDRSAPLALEGATVNGVIYPFSTPDAGVQRVTFYLDGALVRRESNPPFDFRGGDVALALPWDTTRVADGQHTIRAELVLTSGGIQAISATFTVSNAEGAKEPAPGLTPTPTPPEDPAPTPTPTPTPPEDPAPTPPPSDSNGSTQISTGAMLGGGFNPHWFYVQRDGGKWEPTYAGSKLEGRLMNFRAANALFDDEKRADDNPDANTTAFISQLDAYKDHGILALTVSLQGGNPGYEGALVSAFNPDGSLKQAWMERANRVIAAADERGMVIILTYFYQRQDQVLKNEAALKQGVVNATDWLIANDHRNVIIEIANEYPLAGFDHNIIGRNAIQGGIGELINLAKSRFKNAGWRLPVSASRDGIQFKGAIAEVADVALVHGNGYRDWEGERDTYNGMKRVYDNNKVPVVMNEDDNGTTPNATLLSRDTYAMDDAIRAGGSWGLMWKPYNQYHPFGWSLGDPKNVKSEAGYMHAILDVYQDRLD